MNYALLGPAGGEDNPREENSGNLSHHTSCLHRWPRALVHLRDPANELASHPRQRGYTCAFARHPDPEGALPLTTFLESRRQGDHVKTIRLERSVLVQRENSSLAPPGNVHGNAILPIGGMQVANPKIGVPSFQIQVPISTSEFRFSPRRNALSQYSGLCSDVHRPDKAPLDLAVLSGPCLRSARCFPSGRSGRCHRSGPSCLVFPIALDLPAGQFGRAALPVQLGLEVLRVQPPVPGQRLCCTPQSVAPARACL